jgi:hypothetical protein
MPEQSADQIAREFGAQFDLTVLDYELWSSEQEVQR